MGGCFDESMDGWVAKGVGGCFYESMDGWVGEQISD